MSELPAQVICLAQRPKYIGSCEDKSCAGISASFVCGTGIRFSLRIGSDTRSIEDVRYKTNGCAFLIASAESISREIVGRRLTELHGTDSLAKKISKALGDPTPGRQHCSDIALEAFRSALADHRNRTIEEFRGEKALICTCFGVAEETIISVIEAGANDVSRVSAACNAGSGCGSCQMLIRELIDAHENESASGIML
jgi:NifU-like protein involved in Fe-S cluster formation/bacterioferritin-associated ferredoxin